MRIPERFSKIRFSASRPRLRWFPSVMVLLGCIMLVYVGSQYAEMYFEQRSLEKQWVEQQQAQLTKNGPNANQIVQQGLTRIFVPKIDLSAIVVEGTDHHALKLGPGHLVGSPDPGAAGNAVITAHRDTFFRHLVELKKGDQVMLQRDGKTFTYEVSGYKIVKPEDVSVIQPTKDNRLTLITCYPTYYIGPAPERLVVSTKLVGEPEARTQIVSSSMPTPKTLPGDK
jgi:LPXTG-site transpeptidase (sortase) family protein